MPVAVSTKPVYPVPNYQAAVIFTPGDGATNYIRVWCTAAPEGTALRKKIDANKLNRALVFEGNPGSSHPWRTVFEKGGAYTLIVQEYTKGNAWGGGYENDPRGAPSETKNGGESTPPLTLYVAQRLTQPLGFSPDTADLVIYLVNSNIRPTLAAVHGEETPTLQGPSSDKAAAAAKEADVLTAVNALKNDTVLDYAIDANLVFGVIVEFSDHADNTGGTWHQNADTANADVDPLFQIPLTTTSLVAMAAAINKVRARYTLHIQNSTEASPTPGSITIHDQAGFRQDLAHLLMPITADPNNPPTVYAALADFVRAYELHRTSSMHENPDTVNTLTLSAKPLALVHQRFLEALTEPFPSPPSGQTTGGTTLKTFAGFQET